MYNESFGQSLKRGYKGLPIAIRTLITINFVVFLLMVIGGSGFSRILVDKLGFVPTFSTTLFQPWRLVTYIFLHAGGMHIIFNMLWLWWMGRPVEETLGPKVFTVIFLGSGIGGALINLLFAGYFGVNTVIGASGAVFGVMVAFATLFPTTPIMLILLPPIEARYVVAGLIALDVLFIGSTDNVARIVHLGGAGVGYLLVKSHREGIDLTSWMYSLEKKWKSMTQQTASSNSNMTTVSEAEVIDEVDQNELDRILEKISQKGYDGLTKDEKQKLFELSKNN